MDFESAFLYNRASMKKYYFGTAGWSYADWDGIVYPLKKERGFHALLFLARFIDAIEINSTFYRTPQVHFALSWLKKVESYPEFLFTVKLLQLFTHERKSWSQHDIDTFKTGIAPLRDRNRLAAVLIQFPWSFSGTPAHYDYLDRLFRAFPDFPLALEVRHSTWQTPEFYTLLREHGVTFCNIDQPIFNDSIAPGAEVTSPNTAYVRLHGRNYQNWFKKDAGRDARYDYLYSGDELQEWVGRIKELGGKSEKVFVITNNHYQGQALANALQLKNMISGEKVDLPLSLLQKYPMLQKIVADIKKGQRTLFDDETDT
jgi:uncharacterized protein YecE (DUF72 family)